MEKRKSERQLYGHGKPVNPCDTRKDFLNAAVNGDC